MTGHSGSEEEPAITSEGRADASAIVRFRSNGERVTFMVAAVVGAVIVGYASSRSGPLFGILLLLCPIVFLEGLRAEVVVDLERRTISSQRALRRWTGSIEDIEGIRVPPWGPIALTVRQDVNRPAGALWAGQVLTGVYSDRRGRAGRAYQLAEVMGLDVSSIWPQVRPE